MYTISSLGKQGKGLYTIDPERRVYTIEAADPEKEKREGFHGGGVYFRLPCFTSILPLRNLFFYLNLSFA